MENISGFLQSLELLDYGAGNDGQFRPWVEKVYKHIKKQISPLLMTGGDAVTAQIAKKLLSFLRKTSDTGSTNFSFPYKNEFITTSKLVLKEETVESALGMKCCCSDNHKEAGVHDLCESESMDFAGCSIIDKYQPLLMGKLSDSGDIKKHLYISDASGRIMCHTTSLDPLYNNSIVFICCWRYIPPALKEPEMSGYIEILSDPIVLLKAPENEVETGEKLCTFSGVVTNVTSCLRLKTWNFVVDIKPLLGQGSKSVLFTNTKSIYWVSCLHIGSTVEIQGLRRSKLSRGQSIFTVYVLSSNSRLTILDSVIPNDNQLSKFQFINAVCKKLENVHHIDLESCTDRKCPVYIGEITEIICNRLVIFSLDHARVILHSSFCSFADFACAMRVGAVVLITSTHTFKDEQGTVYLVCCAKSNVRVIRHSDKLTGWTPVARSSSLLENNYLSEIRLNQHPAQMVSWVNFMKKVCCNLTLSPSNRFLLGRLLFQKKKSDKDAAENSERRDTFLEVLHSPHSCIAERSLNRKVGSYHLVTVKELKQRALSIAEAKYHKKSAPEYWMQVVIEDCDLKQRDDTEWNGNMFLLGHLKGDYTTGQLTVSDATSAMDCVLVNGAAEGTQNSLSALNLCTTDKSSLIRICKFFVVVECSAKLKDPVLITCSEDLPSTSELEDVTTPAAEVAMHPCIMCSARDVDVLMRENESVLECHEKLGCLDNGALSSDVQDVERGPPAKVQKLGNGSTASCKEYMFAFVTTILPAKKMSFTVYGYLLGRGSIMEEVLFLPHVSLHFIDCAALRPFITPGIMLRIAIPPLHEFKQRKLKSVDIHHGYSISHVHIGGCSDALRTVYEDAKKRWLSTDAGRSLSNVRSVNEVLLHTPRAGYPICIRGRIIVRRSFMESDVLRQRLEMSDVKSSSPTLTVYLRNLSDLHRFNGVMEGATVLLLYVEVFLSLKGNIYAKYTENSDLIVESIPSAALYKSPSLFGNKQLVSSCLNENQMDLSGLEHTLLFDQYENMPFKSSMTCNSAVLKMSLFCVRILNAAVRVHSTKDASSEVSLNAKCLVSDYTGRMYLYFNTQSIDDFFSFIGLSPAAQNEFLQVCRASPCSLMKYDCDLQNGSNSATGALPHLNNELPSAHSALVFMCNQVNCNVMSQRDVVVRRVFRPGQGNSEFYTVGTINAGNNGQDQVVSYNLKLLHYNCVKVLKECGTEWLS